MKDYFYHKLPNGLQIVIVPRGQTRSVTTIVLVKTGSRYEERSISGVSHFLEHMFFKGTKRRPSAKAVSSEIDSIGGEFNAYTDRESTGYHIKAESSHLPLLVDLLADITHNSLFDETEIEREKKVICEELNMWQDDPRRKVSDYFEELLYGAHPLGWDVGGTQDTVVNLTRNQIVSYYNKFYHPANQVIAIAGNCQKEQVLALIKKYFAKKDKKPLEKFIPVKDHQKKPAIKIVYKETDQAHLCVGVRAYPLTDKRRFPMAILDTVLGGGMSSRLFISVRERRGLAYYVFSANFRYSDCGNFFAQTGVSLKRVNEAIKVILAEFSKLATKKITEEELKKAKEYIKGKIALAHEDSRTLAFSYGSSQLLEDKVWSDSQIIAEIEKVTAEEVQNVAADIFKNEKLNLSVIGPFKDEGGFAKILKF